MTDVARITKHPSDKDVVLLNTPPDFNSRFGSFGPARFAREHNCYVMHVEHVDALYRWAKRNDLHVIDERRVGNAHVQRTKPHECRHCGQPGARFNPPTHCPSCGETWHPIEPPVRDDPITKTPCPNCGHKQPGRFPYCQSCGAAMDYERTQPKRHLPRPEKRIQLDDPLPLGDVVKTMLDDHVLGEQPDDPDHPDDHAGDDYRVGRPTRPRDPAYIDGRKVETVPLPDDQAEPEPLTEPTVMGCDCPRARQQGDPGQSIGDLHEYDEWRCFPPAQRDEQPPDVTVEDPPMPWGWPE